MPEKRVLIAVIVIVLLLYAAPEGPVVRDLHRLLVVAPARWLSRSSPAKVLFAIGLCLLAWVMIALLAGEGVKLFTMAAPDAILWFGMFDVATMVDAVLLGLVLSSSVRLSAAMRRIKTLTGRVRVRIGVVFRRGARGRTPADRPQDSAPHPLG